MEPWPPFTRRTLRPLAMNWSAWVAVLTTIKLSNMSQQNVIEIGTAEIQYNRNGIPEGTLFVPAKLARNLTVVEDGLMETEPKSVTDAKDQAQKVLADWFAHVGNIEIADREEGYIDSELVDCEKWPDELPKSCTFRFYWKRR